MSLTNESRRLHEQYENAPENVQRLVDTCWNAFRVELMNNGRQIIGDDRAEILVAYMYDYIRQCPRVAIAKARGE